LAEKEHAALERIFRVLRILNPEERFDAVFEGLRVDDRQVRAGSIEMLSHVVNDELRDGLVALVSFGDEEERLSAAIGYFNPPLAQDALAIAEKSGDNAVPIDANVARDMMDRLRLELADDPDAVLRSVVQLTLQTIEFRVAESA
jgi:hypothetical protein